VKKPNKFILLTILLVVFFIGYIRETIFLVINSVIFNYDFPYNRSYVNPPEYLLNKSTEYLVNVKWFLTILFPLIFLGILIGIIKYYFNNKRYIKYSLVIYFTLFFISFILFALGFLFNNYDFVYPITRFFMGLAQSPLTILVLFVVFYFNERSSGVNN